MWGGGSAQRALVGLGSGFPGDEGSPRIHKLGCQAWAGSSKCMEQICAPDQLYPHQTDGQTDRWRDRQVDR